MDKNKNLKYKVMATLVGVGLLVSPTIAFADATPEPTATPIMVPAPIHSPATMTPAERAAHKVAQEAYKVALVAYKASVQQWRTAREAVKTTFKTSLVSYWSLVKAYHESLRQIDKVFTESINTAKTTYLATTAGKVSAATRQAALIVRVNAVARAATTREVSAQGLPTIPSKPIMGILPVKPTAPVAPVKVNP